MRLTRKFLRLKPCSPAKDFVKGCKSYQQAWTTCENSSWMMWLLWRANPTKALQTGFEVAGRGRGRKILDLYLRGLASKNDLMQHKKKNLSPMYFTLIFAELYDPRPLFHSFHDVDPNKIRE